MLSPLQAWKDRKMYGRLGTSFRKTHINRPAFDIFGTTIEFDINPKDWMLAIMRHFRILRLVLPSWHKKEKQINLEIRKELLGSLTKVPDGERRKRLKLMENIKGYRDVRYKSAEGIVKFDSDDSVKGKPQEQV
jgi:indolepyruvate ferredoxin oxidoreductase